MKTLTFLLALSLTSPAAFAQNFSMTSLTPSLDFPEGKSDGETVSMDQNALGN